MQIFKTGKQVTRAVKNVQRLRTILGVFGRHGLEDFLIRMGLGRHIASIGRAEGVEQLTVPERLRKAFESLGPTFVKLGQLLSNRPDMIPENFVEEFKKLQDNVPPVEFSLMKKQIEAELGGLLENHFLKFNEQPLAAASIGQVYEATLLSGEDVVVKVQRPDIERIVKNDISILSFLADMMEKYLPETRIIGPKKIVEEFFKTLNFEIDFVVEANNMVRIAENFKDNPQVMIPKVYRKYSTHKVLTMQRFYGARITDVEALNQMGVSPVELVNVGARAFFKMVLIDGLFHGDLHAGNLFAMKDPVSGLPQIGVIDFGIVGRLSQKSRDSFSKMVIALITEDYENLCYEYAELATFGAGIDIDGFQREVRNSLAPYMGLMLKDVNLGHVLIESTKIAVKYNIRVPSDWMLVFKAIFTMEGLGRQLDPEFDFLSIGNELVKDVLKERYSVLRMSKDLVWVARDISALIQVMPRQIRLMFKKFNANDFAFELKFKETEVIRKQVEVSFRGLGFAIISSGFFVASALSLNMQTDHKIWKYYPLPSLIFFFLGTVGFLRLLFKRWK